MRGLIGKKLGMTRIYDENGFIVPVTLIQAGPCTVTQIKTDEKDGYEAVQVGYGERKTKHTKKPLWLWQRKNKKFFKTTEFVKILLQPTKLETESRIKTRFDQMLRDGAIEEAESFKKIKVNSINSSNFIIGLKEISEFLDGKISLSQLKEKVLIRTRQYAKRQFTWQRGQMKDWKGFSDTNYLDLRKKILSYLSKT